MSFATGVFPDVYKLTGIISVFKDDYSSSCTNYRRTPLASTFSKIFEKRRMEDSVLIFRNSNYYINTNMVFVINGQLLML